LFLFGKQPFQSAAYFHDKDKNTKTQGKTQQLFDELYKKGF